MWVSESGLNSSVNSCVKPKENKALHMSLFSNTSSRAVRRATRHRIEKGDKRTVSRSSVRANQVRDGKDR